ncbi:AmmeMemoRadiSam system radical SAM enzyme [Leminorella grimontii]|uniref:AmmeMemoRadiSam system radical SAM enzyme n=1 Tax=Leminorella grimontii TaxID=82981 RepID=UPI002080AADA|nr:AmmeMemoRadiSam system radical SAM enzyme [Leminorella grimontii]GKX61142.1 hypothetical protein SOASR031_34570 [Leminorella grimontii]
MARKQWQQTGYSARLWRPLADNAIRCELCPRSCKIIPGRTGTCRMRRNENGSLVSLNYGKSVPMTQESIETEAVYHYAPGEKILSLGNIGCMLHCDFCQNWTTSQARYVQDNNVMYYSPEDVVNYALKHNIRVLSWTYNDPVVWHEFVMETAKLGRERGLKNLYKSAFYISEKGIDELLGVMDIFSISLKSMQDSFYRKHTGGRLAPILDGIKQVYDARKGGSGPHLEISNLCVTGRNDSLTESRRVSDWMLNHLDEEIPLHYVRFHPDYRYTDVERTSIPFLEQARVNALADGMRYVYLGNVYGTDSANSYCPDCQTQWVKRNGLVAHSFLKDGCCPNCGKRSPIVLPWGDKNPLSEGIRIPADLSCSTHMFRGAIQACHIEQDEGATLYYQFISSDGQPVGEVGMNGCARFMLSKSDDKAAGIQLYHPEKSDIRLFEVYDRAHFPVMSAEQTQGTSEDVPITFHPLQGR